MSKDELLAKFRSCLDFGIGASATESDRLAEVALNIEGEKNAAAAIVNAFFVAAALGIFAYVAGHAVFSGYLGLPFLPGSGELAILCAALAGAGLGFLWFNTYPAQIFMGDIGAVAVGAALGLVAVIVRQELVFIVMAGVFVMETVSVILRSLRSS